MSPRDSTEVELHNTELSSRQFSLLLGLLVFAAFPGVLLGKATFVLRDYGLFSYPVAFFQRESFWRGELPLWNPLSLCGVPFLAQWNTLTLYPPALIYLLLPLGWSLSFFCLLHLFWGGLGMFFLARRWTGDALAAAVAGVIFSFSGLNLNFLMWPSHVATFSWVPWVVWLVPQAWSDGGRKLGAGVLASSLQMLAGGPETILFTWLVVGVFFCGEWLAAKESRRRITFRFFALVLLVALICAAQLLPFIDLVTHSQRDTGYGSTDWAMPVWGWANLLVPLFRASPTPQGVYYQDGQYWTSSYFLGIGTLWLSLIAVFHSRDWRARSLAALLVLSLLFALGNSGLVYRGLRHLLPILGFIRYPVKFVILTSAVAPLLAAFGLKALVARGKLRISGWSLAAAIFVLIVAVAFSSWKFSPNNFQATLFNACARAVFLALVCALTALVLAKNGRPRLFSGCAILFIFWVDFLTHVPQQNPTVSPEVYTAGWAREHSNWDPPPRLGESRAMITPEAEQALKYRSITNLAHNYMLDRLGLLANCNLLDGVPQAHGFFSLIPEFASDAVTAPYALTNNDFSTLLDFMGVSQVNAPGDPFKWARRAGAMPLVTAGQQPIFAEDRSAFQAFYQTNTDLAQTVFLEPQARAHVSAVRQSSARILKTDFTAQNIRIQVTTPAPAMVVVAQSYYRGWKAYIDGSNAPLWRANYAFQAVEVPAGSHSVQLVYQDRTFIMGVILSLLGVAILLGHWLLARLQASRHSPETRDWHEFSTCRG